MEAAAAVRPAEGDKEKEANKPKTGGSSIGVIKVSFIHLQIQGDPYGRGKD